MTEHGLPVFLKRFVLHGSQPAGVEAADLLDARVDKKEGLEYNLHMRPCLDSANDEAQMMKHSDSKVFHLVAERRRPKEYFFEQIYLSSSNGQAGLLDPLEADSEPSSSSTSESLSPGSPASGNPGASGPAQGSSNRSPWGGPGGPNGGGGEDEGGGSSGADPGDSLTREFKIGFPEPIRDADSLSIEIRFENVDLKWQSLSLNFLSFLAGGDIWELDPDANLDSSGYNLLQQYSGIFTGTSGFLGDYQTPGLADGIVTGTDYPDVQRAGYGDAIDDLQINLTVAPIDGEGNTLGRASTDFVYVDESGNRLANAAVEILIDEADVGTTLNDDLTKAVILHELMHAVGFSNDIWEAYDATDRRGDFTGSDALTEYKNFDPSATAIPVEKNRPGTGGSHWSDEKIVVEGSPLMGGFLSAEPTLYVFSFLTFLDAGFQGSKAALDDIIPGEAPGTIDLTAFDSPLDPVLA